MDKSKKTDRINVRTSIETKQKLYQLAQKYTWSNSGTEVVEISLDLLEKIGEMADQYAKGSIEVMIYKIQEKFPVEEEK